MRVACINYNLVRKLLETGHDVNEVAQLLNIDVSGIYRYCRNNNMTIIDSMYHPEIPYVKRKYKTPRKIVQITYRYGPRTKSINKDLDYLFDINNITLEDTLIPSNVDNDNNINSYNTHNETEKAIAKFPYSDHLKKARELIVPDLKQLATNLTEQVINAERGRECDILKKIKSMIFEAYRASYGGDLATKTILRNTLDYIDEIITEPNKNC